MSRLNFNKIDESIKAFLGTKYHLVGVKIIKSPIQGKNPLRPEKPMAYCQMVRVASQVGKTFLFDKSDQNCPTAELCLGFREPRYSEIEPRVKPSDTKSVLVAPINQMPEEPDIILVILTPKQMMDLAAILQAEKSDLLTIGFKGEAACGEFTAKPYMEHKPNLSFLCNGARLVFSEYRDNELIFGAPLETYLQLVEKIDTIMKASGALCGCLVSDLSAEVINEFKKIGFSKGTDYFFGRVDGWDVRVYLNKDFQGRYKFITIHLPIKMPSEEKASEALKKLEKFLLRPYRVSQRDYWLDLSMTASADELAIDILIGESVNVAIKETINNMVRNLRRAGIEVK